MNTTQKAKENLLPPKSGTANPTPQDYSKLRNPPMSSQYRHNSADESRPIMNSKHIPKPMTVQNHEERRDQLRNVVSEGKQSRPPLPNQNNKFAEFPAAKQHVTIEEDGYAYNNRYGKPAPNDHYQPEFQYNYVIIFQCGSLDLIFWPSRIKTQGPTTILISRTMKLIGVVAKNRVVQYRRWRTVLKKSIRQMTTLKCIKRSR